MSGRSGGDTRGGGRDGRGGGGGGRGGGKGFRDGKGKRGGGSLAKVKDTGKTEGLKYDILKRLMQYCLNKAIRLSLIMFFVKGRMNVVVSLTS